MPHLSIPKNYLIKKELRFHRIFKQGKLRNASSLYFQELSSKKELHLIKASVPQFLLNFTQRVPPLNSSLNYWIATLTENFFSLDFPS